MTDLKIEMSDAHPESFESGDAEPKRSDKTWGSLATWMAAVGAIAAYVLHTAGHTMHETYLSSFGVDPGVFPRSIDSIALLGQLAILDRLLAFFLEFASLELFRFLLVMGCFALYLFGAVFMGRKLGGRKLPNTWWRKHSVWVGDLFMSAAVATGLLLSVPVASLFLIVIFMFPISFGQAAAHAVYKEQMSRFELGCQSTLTTDRCIEIRSHKKLLAKGFLIDSSTSHIAVFDVQLKQARVLEREGTEIRVVKASK